MCFVVRRLASATSVVRTGTPACSESSRRSRASSSSASGSKRLKSRSKSSGASTLSSSTSAAAPSAAGTGHHVGQMRADQTRAVRPRPARTAPRDSPLARSPSHAPNDCVENPQRRSQTQPRQAESGSRTNADTTSTSTVSSKARAHHGPPVASQSQRPGGPNAITTSTASCNAQSANSAA